MTVPRMHEEEVEIDDGFVRRLLTTQLPHLAADRALQRIEAWGTDHVIFRLGDDLSVRLPKIGWAAKQGEKEARWLQMLAPHVPVEVPVPLAVGDPTDDYPFRWYVSPWLEGDHPKPHGDTKALALDLADFVRALQRVDTTGAPTPRPGQRGGVLEPADRFIRERAEQLRGEADVDGLLAVWDAGRNAPPYEGPPVWVHGDLMDGNLLVSHDTRRLTGIIDWGGLMAADPAVELMIAWNFFDPETRNVYRDALGFVDDAMWLRGKAWAASHAIAALPYYRDTNRDIVARAWRGVKAVLEEEEEEEDQ